TSKSLSLRLGYSFLLLGDSLCVLWPSIWTSIFILSLLYLLLLKQRVHLLFLLSQLHFLIHLLVLLVELHFHNIFLVQICHWVCIWTVLDKQFLIFRNLLLATHSLKLKN